MESVRRWIAGALGLGILALGFLWTRGYFERHPLYVYNQSGFLGLGPGEFAFGLRSGLAGMVAVLFLTMASAPWFARLQNMRARTRMPWILLPLLASGAVAIASMFLLRGNAVTDDERVYRFQAELLARGKATWPAPPLSDFLKNVFVVVQEGRWFGQYPPGHPAALVPAVLLGFPRLLPILLAGVNAALAGLVLRQIAGPRSAALGLCLLVVSPLFVLTGATLLSHTTSFFGLALATWGALRCARTRRARWGVVAGIGLGVLFLTRPYTGITLGLFPAGMLVWAAWKQQRGKTLLLAALPVVLSGFALLAYNHAVTGDPLVSGYDAIRGEQGTIELGFGRVLTGEDYVHTPAKGLRNAAVLAFRFSLWAFGAPVLLALGVLGCRSRAGMIALAALGAGILSYIPYWSVGVNDTGPVKAYELLLPATVLATLGLREAARRYGAGIPMAFSAASCLAAGTLFWPGQAAHVREVSGYAAEPLESVRSKVELPALVFVSNVQPPEARTWVFGRPNPKPDLSDPILYVRDLGPTNLAFWKAHPDRKPYRMQYNEKGTLVILPLVERK